MFKRIYAFRYGAEAGTIISLLKNNGYHPLDLQLSPHVGTAGADIYYYVQVPEEEYESAKQFLITLGYKKVI